MMRPFANDLPVLCSVKTERLAGGQSRRGASTGASGIVRWRGRGHADAGRNRIDVVRDLHSSQPGARVIVLTGYGSIAAAVAAVRLGASDYLSKPADADRC